MRWRTQTGAEGAPKARASRDKNSFRQRLSALVFRRRADLVAVVSFWLRLGAWRPCASVLDSLSLSLSASRLRSAVFLFFLFAFPRPFSTQPTRLNAAESRPRCWCQCFWSLVEERCVRVVCAARARGARIGAAADRPFFVPLRRAAPRRCAGAAQPVAGKDKSAASSSSAAKPAKGK